MRSDNRVDAFELLAVKKDDALVVRLQQYPVLDHILSADAKHGVLPLCGGEKSMKLRTA